MMACAFRSRAAFALAAAAWLAGCASSRLDAQWADPQLTPGALRGARILVVCEASDLAIKRICQDQLAAEVVARGGTPVPVADGASAMVRPLNNDQYLPAAREANAKAVFVHSLTTADVGSSGTGVSLGIGGFRVGGGGGGGVGVGVSMPVGGAQTNTGYALNSRVAEVASGRVLWTAKASASPSADASAQLAELTRAVFDAADKAQLF